MSCLEKVQHGLIHYCDAGRLAGAAGTTVTCPLEVVKTRLQVSAIKMFIVFIYSYNC